MGMSNREFDRRCAVVEEALGTLKETAFVCAPHTIRALDDLLGSEAQVKVELYALIHSNQEPGE